MRGEGDWRSCAGGAEVSVEPQAEPTLSERSGLSGRTLLAHGEGIQRAACITLDATRVHQQVAWDGIEPPDRKLYATHAGQHANSRPLAAGRAQRTMHGGRLRGIFDCTRATELLVRTQRMIGVAMRSTSAQHLFRIPGE